MDFFATAEVAFVSETLAPLPHNIDAERGVLSAMLQGVDARFAIEQLIPTDFFSALHRRFFSRLKSMCEEGEPVTLITALEPLGVDEVETAELAALLDPSLVVRGAGDLTAYTLAVKKHSLHRSLLAANQKFLEANGDAPLLARELAAITQRYLGALEKTNKTGEPPDWREMFHTFADFENATDLTFAIRGFLQNDGATMLGGLSGHGKTLALLSITKALLAGKGARLWNLFDVEEAAARVVYLIPECAIQPFKYRLRLFRLYETLAPNDDRLLVRTLSKGATPALSDPRILYAAKGAHIILDTATRFTEGDENSAGDNQRGLASDIFALLGAGAKSVLAAHHSPKPFARENVMRLENVLRGSGDVGAMLSTAWGIKQLDAAQNIVHVENLKPRDFEPTGPFQLIGRPNIDQSGDFGLYKKPGDCGSLQDEQKPDRDQGGAPAETRKERARRIALVKDLLTAEPKQTNEQLRLRLAAEGVKVSTAAVKKYKKEVSDD